MTRKRALRRMKIKAAFAAAWGFVKGYLSFSKLLCYGVLLLTTKRHRQRWIYAISQSQTTIRQLAVFDCADSVIAAATATVLSFALNKSKAENTAGGIVYETTLKRDC